MTDVASRTLDLADIQDLIEIVDRRVLELRQRGPVHGLQELEALRARLFQLRASVLPNTNPEPWRHR
jgi:hypothetical protein